MRPEYHPLTVKSSRRELLASGAAAMTLGGGSAGIAKEPSPSPAARGTDNGSPFLFGLNTSTIREQHVPLAEEIKIAQEVGYHGMEPWMDEIQKHVAGGGTLDDLGKRFRDAGISVESVIDFFEWATDDDARRKKGLEAARRSLETVQKIGGLRVAAPASGATDHPVELGRLVERYAELLKIADEFGVVPMVEVWGFSKTLNKLGEAAYVAIESGHPKACVLPDVFHLYKGGSPLEGIRLLSPSAIQVFHVNDYPGSPEREKLTDADRVYPGDGVAPYGKLLKLLRDGGFKVMLSLELFNREYWKQDVLTVARTGIEKMKALVQASEA